MIAFLYAYLIVGVTVWLWIFLETDHIELIFEVAIFYVLIFAWLPLLFTARKNMVCDVYLDNMAARKKQDFKLYMGADMTFEQFKTKKAKRSGIYIGRMVAGGAFVKDGDA